MTTNLNENLKRDIDIISKKVLKMGELVTIALRTSLQAFVERDRQLAYLVILRDKYIDELEKEIDQLCQKFLVTQMPAAGNLRFVWAVIKINNEIERVGDYAESIARQVLNKFDLIALSDYTKYQQIGEMSISLFNDALHSFLKKDAEHAKSIVKNERLERKVDSLRYQIHDDVLALRGKDKIPMAGFQPLMIIASRFERVADQAVNMSEETIFYCTGEDPKHQRTLTYHVLFVDETDSCLTKLACAAARSMNLKEFEFTSAGLEKGEVDQTTANFLLQKGITAGISGCAVVDRESLADYQIIIALTKKGQAAFPEFPTKTVTLSWGLNDPCKMKGTPAEIQKAFEKIYTTLNTNINDLVTAILGEASNFSEEK